MILKEPLEQPDIQSDSDNNAMDTDKAEMQKLRQMVKDAYPAANGRIAARVMEQIRLEKEKGFSSAKAFRRRMLRAQIMKWGGMAACMVILCGALVIASPLMQSVNGAERADSVSYVQDADNLCDEAEAYSLPTEQSAEKTQNAAVMETAVENSSDTEVRSSGAEAGETTPFSYPTADAEDSMGIVSMETQQREETEASSPYGSEALLEALLAKGLLSETDYLDWMQKQGYSSPEDWTLDAISSAFGISAEQMDKILEAVQ